MLFAALPRHDPKDFVGHDFSGNERIGLMMGKDEVQVPQEALSPNRWKQRDARYGMTIYS
jgi:hypothetical protein